MALGGPGSARVRAIYASPSPPFNGKKVQVNSNGIQGGFDYPFLNALKTAQSWSFSGTTTSPITPDVLDSNGYLISQAAGAGQGIFTVFPIPTQTERPGNYIIKWNGDGTVTSGSMNAAAWTLQFTSVSQVGTTQTLQMVSIPAVVAVGMPLAISGLSGGTWATLNNTWPVTSVDTVNNTISFNTGTTFTGSPVVSGTAKVTSVTTTTTALGLNGSGRYVAVPATPSATVRGGYNGLNLIQGSVRINTIQSPTNYPHDIIFCHQDDEALLANGQVFTTKFLQTYANFGVFRGLGWQNANTSFITNWASRKPQNYVFYHGSDYRNAWYCGTTTQSAAAYSVGFPSVHSSDGSAWTSGGPKDKDTIHVLIGQNAYASVASVVTGTTTAITVTTGAFDTTFTNGETVWITGFANGTGTGWTGLNGNWVATVSGNTITIPVDSTGFTGTYAGGTVNHSAPTLSVGGGAAIGIRDKYSNPYNTYSTLAFVGGASQSFATLVYDAGLNDWIKIGGCVGDGATGLVNEAPPEIMLLACTQLGAHPHWIAPPFAVDPITDFMPSLMTICKNQQTASPWMIPRFEGCNELWNGAGGFIQTVYANNKVAAYGWASPSYHQWYGMVMSVIGQTAQAIWGAGNLGTKYAVLCGVQTSTGTNNTAGSNNRLEWASFTAPGSLSGVWGTINYSAVAAAPAGGAGPNYVSHVTPATYFSTNLYGATNGSQTEAALVSSFNGAQFTATSIVNGVMSGVVMATGTLAIGMTVWGGQIGYGAGVTITGGSGSSWTLSDATLNCGYLATYYAGSDMTAPQAYADAVVDTVVNATISGANFTINSITSGNAACQGLVIYGGTVALSSQVKISSGTYPNFVLSSSPGDQTASFSIGKFDSLTTLAFVYQNWAAWGHSHGVNKMHAYEGDYSPDYTTFPGNPLSQTDLLRAASRKVSNMQTYATTNFTNFANAGNGITGFVCEFPSELNVTGGYPSNNVWSLLEDIYAPASSSPEYLAVLVY